MSFSLTRETRTNMINRTAVKPLLKMTILYMAIIRHAFTEDRTNASGCLEQPGTTHKAFGSRLSKMSLFSSWRIRNFVRRTFYTCMNLLISIQPAAKKKSFGYAHYKIFFIFSSPHRQSQRHVSLQQPPLLAATHKVL